MSSEAWHAWHELRQDLRVEFFADYYPKLTDEEIRESLSPPYREYDDKEIEIVQKFYATQHYGSTAQQTGASPLRVKNTIYRVTRALEGTLSPLSWALEMAVRKERLEETVAINRRNGFEY